MHASITRSGTLDRPLVLLASVMVGLIMQARPTSATLSTHAGLMPPPRHRMNARLPQAPSVQRHTRRSGHRPRRD